MGLTYAVLGAGSSAAIQASLLLLEQDNTDMIFGIGRNPLPTPTYSFNLAQNPKFKYVQLHLTREFDQALVLLDEVKPDIIVNYAAQGETSVSWQNSWCFFETNCVMLSRLTEELAKRTWLQRFIHIGTTGVYGSPGHAITESEPLNPATPYAVTKAAFDMYIQSIQAINKLPINILRTTTIYCPGQRTYKLIPRATISGLKGEKFPLHAGGMLKKSYIHARDLARAVLLVSQKAPVGKIYNVAPDKPILLRDLVTTIAQQLELTLEQLSDITEPRLLQDTGSWLDCSALMHDTNWDISIGLEAGIQEVIAWAKLNYAELQAAPTSYVFSK